MIFLVLVEYFIFWTPNAGKIISCLVETNTFLINMNFPNFSMFVCVCVSMCGIFRVCLLLDNKTNVCPNFSEKNVPLKLDYDKDQSLFD